ncbi:MAG: neutral/alkaline non-lysosomal ceramidase N-terminal domain-containing protein [Pirellulales bacterium]
MRTCFAMKCLTVCFAWLLVANGSYGWAAPHPKGKFQMGTGVIDITPPIGYRMSGYFHERLSTGVKDPLLAKAIVFSQGDTVAALVVCDLVGIAPEVSSESRRLIADQIDIPANNVSIAATHSHTGPLYWGALRDQFHQVTIAREGSDSREKFDYPAFLTKQLVAAVDLAKQNLAVVNLSAGSGTENRVAFNRRFLMKNGRAKTWIGLNHPDVIRAAGPIDPEVGLIRFDGVVSGKPHASITCYALHLDTLGGTEYSADYPYYLQQDLAKAYGDRFVSLFGIGTCGDINHANTSTKERNKTDEIGRMLAESVAQAMPDLQPVSGPSLAVAHKVVNVPKQKFTTEQIAQAKKEMARVGDRDVPFAKRVEAYKITALQHYPSELIPLEIHAFRLSPDVAIITLPGEIFVELGLHIKSNSPFKTTLVIELANDAPGYIPTNKAFVEGGYEVINSRIAPGGGEMLVETAIRLLREVHGK